MNCKKLENEKQEHYQLFLYYAIEGHNRNLTRLAQESDLSYRQIHRISVKNNWKERVMNFDKSINDQIHNKLVKRYKSNKEKSLELKIENQNRINELNDKLNKKTVEFLDPTFSSETYIKRANFYITILLKIQRFQTKLENQLEQIDVEYDEDFEFLEQQLTNLDRFEENNVEQNLIGENENFAENYDKT
jgi:hypothetical protein